MLRHPAQRVVASSLLIQVTLVVSGPLAVRLLGLEARGEAAVVFAAVLLVGQVLPWGIPQAFAYALSRGAADPRRLIRTYGRRYLWLSLVAGIVAVIVLAVGTTAREVDHPGAQLALAFVGTVGTMWAVLVYACLQGAGRFTALALLQAVPGVAYAVALTVLLVVGKASVLVVLALYFAGWWVAIVVGLWLLLRQAPTATAALPAYATLRSYGRRAAVAAAAPIDNLGIDQLMVGLVLGHHALGTYVVALAFKTPAAAVLIAVAGVCTTQVARLEDRAAQRVYCRRWLLRSLVIGLVAVGLVEVVIDPVLVPVFGHDAAVAGATAHLLVLTALPLGLRRVAAGLLQGIGRPAPATRAELVGLAVMIGTMVPLGQRHGAEGAVVALGAGATVAAVLSLVALRAGLRTPLPAGEATAPH